jgi:hypothetical protein
MDTFFSSFWTWEIGDFVFDFLDDFLTSIDDISIELSLYRVSWDKFPDFHSEASGIEFCSLFESMFDRMPYHLKALPESGWSLHLAESRKETSFHVTMFVRMISMSMGIDYIV